MHVIVHKLLKNGIKVYPVLKHGKWKIQVDSNGRKKTFQKELTTPKQINEAIKKTMEFLYEKI